MLFANLNSVKKFPKGEVGPDAITLGKTGITE